MELWNEAQLVWGPEPLDSKLQCLVSIGTGIPSLRPFSEDVLDIGKTLVAIATETEQTAERFRRDKTSLDNNNRYFRFNVIRGLEDIGLEESAKAKEIAAATRRYVSSQEIFRQMQACATNLRPPKPVPVDPMAALLAALPSAGNQPYRQDLVNAAKDGDEDVVKALLAKGADVNSKGDLDNLPAFWHAAYRGHVKVAKLLIDTGKLKIDQKDGYLVTPFFWAVSNSHDAVVELMLRTGKVDVNVKDRQRRTPLIVAAQNGDERIVKLLLESGKADISARMMIMNRTALETARHARHDGVVRLLESYHAV
jgi:hypothetical protein